jgi:hypothetical protein
MLLVRRIARASCLSKPTLRQLSVLPLRRQATACLRQIKIGGRGEFGAYNEHGPVPMPKMCGRIYGYSNDANADLEAGLCGL